MTELTFANDKRGYYVPSDLMNLDAKQMAKEYTRLRDIAHKRIVRLKERNILSDDEIKNFESYIPKIAQLRESDNFEDSLRYALSGVSRLLNKKPSTIPAAKEWKAEKERLYKEAAKEFGIDTEKVPANVFWDFVNYSKNILHDNIFYWTTRKKKFLFDNADLIEKLNAKNFAEVTKALSAPHGRSAKKNVESYDFQEDKQESIDDMLSLL